MTKEEFNKLQESFAALSTKFKTVIASPGEMSEDKKEMMEMMYAIMDNIDRRISYVHDRINETQDYTVKHCNSNHVPPLKAAAMQKFLKVVGMEDDYEVSKPMIYCSASRHGATFEAEYVKPK